MAGYSGLGTFVEQETLTSKLGASDQPHVSLWWLNSHLELQRRLNEQMRIFSTTYYEPTLINTADFRMLEQVSTLVKLRQKLELKVRLDISFDSRPPQSAQKRDMLYSTGLDLPLSRWSGAGRPAPFSYAAVVVSEPR